MILQTRSIPSFWFFGLPLPYVGGVARTKSNVKHVNWKIKEINKISC